MSRILLCENVMWCIVNSSSSDLEKSVFSLVSWILINSWLSLSSVNSEWSCSVIWHILESLLSVFQTDFFSCWYTRSICQVSSTSSVYVCDAF